MLLVVSIGVKGVPAQVECKKPIPEIYRQLSPVVVLITTFNIDPFKLTDRLVTSMGSGFILSPEGLFWPTATWSSGGAPTLLRWTTDKPFRPA